MEIEHKFLVHNRDFQHQATAVRQIRQGYLSSQPELTVRVRIADDQAFLTLKGPSRDGGLSREEWEYAIPPEDARGMFALCNTRIIEKERYLVPHYGHLWEVDVFHGRLEGLIIAEVEVASTDETFARPEWLGREVTGDRHYYNAYLSQTKELPLTY